MKQYYVIIDMGTSNTRIRLLDKNGLLIDEWKSALGVGISAVEGSNAKLKENVKLGIETIIKRNEVNKNQIIKILASGMITSNVGLFEIPHLTAPVGKEELSEGIKEVLMEEIIDIPISFVPGIKNGLLTINIDNFERMDIMRGEEVEVISILKHIEKGKDYLIVLPGSHTKFVTVNQTGKITGCLTTLCGELISCVTKHTIIANSVGGAFVKSYNREMVLKGFNMGAKVGLSRGLFSGRIMSQFLKASENDVANYILGVILQSDMTALRNTEAISIKPNCIGIVAGKEPLKEALIDVMIEDGYIHQVLPYLYENEHMSAEGAFSIVAR